MRKTIHMICISYVTHIINICVHIYIYVYMDSEPNIRFWSWNFARPPFPGTTVSVCIAGLGRFLSSLVFEAKWGWIRIFHNIMDISMVADIHGIQIHIYIYYIYPQFYTGKWGYRWLWCIAIYHTHIYIYILYWWVKSDISCYMNSSGKLNLLHMVSI